MGRAAAGLMIRMVSVGSAFLLGILLARLLGPNEYGQFTYILSYLLLASGIIRTGASNLIVREVAAYNEKSENAKLHGFLVRFFQIITISSLIISLIFYAYVEYVSARIVGQVRSLIIVGLPLILLTGVMGFWESTTRGFGHMSRGQMAEFFVRPILLLLLITILLLGILPVPLNSVSAMGAYSAATLLAAIVAFLLRSRSQLNHVVKFHPEYETAKWLKNCFKLSAVGWISLLSIHLTPIQLGLMSSNDQVANFQISSQFAFIISLMVVIMNSNQASDISRHFSSGNFEKIQRLASKSCNISTAFSSIFFIIYILFGREIISFTVGNEYKNMYEVLLIVSLGTFINSITGSVGTIMNSCHMEKDAFLAVLAAVLAICIANFFLIPRFGALGAAIGIVISLTIWNAIFVIRVRQVLGIWSLPLLTAR